MRFNLKCNLCGIQCRGRNKWFRHILNSTNHQNLARRKLPEWILNKKASKSLLVAYSRKPIATDQLLKFLSGNDKHKDSIVRDLVWFDDRPHIGLIKFKKGRNLNYKLKQLGSAFQVEGEGTIQVRKALDYLELEWAELFPNLPPLCRTIEKCPDQEPAEKDPSENKLDEEKENESTFNAAAIDKCSNENEETDDVENNITENKSEEGKQNESTSFDANASVVIVEQEPKTYETIDLISDSDDE